MNGKTEIESLDSCKKRIELSIWPTVLYKLQ